MNFKYKISVCIVFISLQISFAQTVILKDTVFSPALRAFTIDSSVSRFTLQCSCDSFELEDVTFGKKIKFYRNQKKITTQEIESGRCFCSSCLRSSTIISNHPKSNFVINTFGCSSNIEFKNSISNPKKIYAVGDKLMLNNILFVAGKSILISSSYKELNALVDILNEQNELKILVRGHVNGQKKSNMEEYKELSEKRAKTIVDYLINKGVQSERLKFEGVGNTEMVYPKPKTEEEMILNRRVEIIIW
jgi:outer membrane protein OmpA-like peptidoglycan-associated protein